MRFLVVCQPDEKRMALHTCDADGGSIRVHLGLSLGTEVGGADAGAGVGAGHAKIGGGRSISGADEVGQKRCFSPPCRSTIGYSKMGK